MDFIKMHGAGNDFVMLDCVKNPEQLPDVSELARKLCDRHKSIGADGLILVGKGERAPFSMAIINSDGSNGEMCGNGVRCTGRLLVEEGHQPMDPFDLEVGPRIVHIEPLAIDRYRVDMGLALLKRGEVGVTGESDSTFIDQEICADGSCWKATAVFTGNPHLAVFCEDPQATDLEKVGPLLERHKLFPKKINVHFVNRVGENHLRMRTWERGVGITLACGSGACSVGVAAFLNGLTGRKMTIDLPGGRLDIEYMEDGRVFMEGPAARVFAGRI